MLGVELIHASKRGPVRCHPNLTVHSIVHLLLNIPVLMDIRNAGAVADGWANCIIEIDIVAYVRRVIFCILIQWGRDKMAVISQIFSNAFSGTKMREYRLECH